MKTIDLQNKKYPELLKKIDTPPKKLYYKGNWNSALFNNCLAVVGSRKMTSYGKQVTKKLVGEIAAAEITIVSGFMYGIDATSHRAAIDFGGRTIAVMPCGINIIHPEYQEELYNDILKNKGLIISEFEGDFAPAPWTYPKRNRIVAGLSKAILVVEAGLKSGSLITADFAKKYKRKICAVPGQITSETSKGTLQLIQNGAIMATSAKDILEYFDIEWKKKQPALMGRGSLNGVEWQIIEQLEREPLEIDILARTIGMPISKLGTTLSMMQLKGFVFQEEGKYHIN